MRQAFISYSRKDKALAIKLNQDLEFRGLSTWIDLEDIPAGAEWPDRIEKAIEECPFFVLLLSPNSVCSDYVRREYSLALERNKQVIPVLLESCDIPDTLAHIQYVDLLDYDESLRRILAIFPETVFIERGSIQSILDSLKSINPETRVSALQLIAVRRLTETLQAVIAAMSDSDSEVRANAAWALDQLSKPEAIDVLIKGIHDKDPQVRANSGWALAHLGSQAVSEVIKVLRDSSDINARETAHLILERIPGKDAQDAIRRYWS